MKQLLWLGLAAGVLSPAGAQESSVLPTTRVVLFTSGVGFFEHGGQVTDNAVLRLAFEEAGLNDVLKSLVVRDDRATALSARYQGQDPLARTLEGFSVDLGGNPALNQVLTQLRGAQVNVNAGAQLRGRIFSLENRVVPSGESTRPETFLNLWTEAGLRSVPLSGLTSLQFEDPALRDEFDRALAVIEQGRNTRRRSLELHFEGRGARPVRVGYVTAAPVWKTTYRLDLTGGKAQLQGWAIVENTTDQDWTGVRLSLVSGQPVSFIQDLYTPYYVNRPRVALNIPGQLAPVASESGVVSRPVAEAASRARAGAAAPPPAPSPMAMPSAADFGPQEDFSGPVGAPPPQATGSAAGELFEFTLNQPVNLARRQSALLPLISGDLEGRKVAVVNTHSGRPPMNAVWLTNSSGQRLPGGPFTIFDEGIYAGDAVMDLLPEGARRLVAYAGDLQLKVLPQSSGALDTTRILIANGVLTFQRIQTFLTRYELDNGAARPKTVVVEHPYSASRTLAAPAQAEERTASLYRFVTEVPGGQKRTLEVRETQPRTDTVALLNLRGEAFLSYTSQQGISPGVRQALERAAQLRRRVDEIDTRLADLDRQRSELEQTQARTRQNLASVGASSPQGQRFVQRLMDDETRLESLAAERSGQAEARREAQGAFENYLKELNVQ